jgi:Ribbon-helix-helix domain
MTMALSKRMTQLGCTITVEQRAALSAVAKRLKIPITELVRQAIDAYLATSNTPAEKPAKGGKRK